MGMNKKAKVMKVGDDEKHDKAVYLWFKQKGMESIPISGSIWCEKAVQLHKMYGQESRFSGSTGWQWRYATCPFKGTNFLLIERPVQLSSHLSVDLSKSASSLLIKHSIVMRLDSTFACCQKRHF